MDNSLLLKYNIVEIDKNRYYIQDLNVRSYDLENTTPFLLDVEGHSIFTSSWVNLLVETVRYLLDNYTPKDQIYNFSVDFSSQKFFTDTMQPNLRKVDENLYIRVNFRSVHSFWILMELLKFFDVDIAKCKFLIHRTPGAEPNECREFYRKKTISEFTYYYTNLLKKEKDQADRIIKNINVINRYMPAVSKSYNDLWLFPDKTTFKSYKVKLMNHLRKVYKSNIKNAEIANKYLNKLEEFYNDLK